jgi:hypothetical protein
MGELAIRQPQAVKVAKSAEKGSEEARRLPHSRAADPNRAKSSQGSVGEGKKESKKSRITKGTNPRARMTAVFEIAL